MLVVRLRLTILQRAKTEGDSHQYHEDDVLSISHGGIVGLMLDDSGLDYAGRSFLDDNALLLLDFGLFFRTGFLTVGVGGTVALHLGGDAAVVSKNVLSTHD